MDKSFHGVFGAMEMANGNFLGKNWDGVEGWIGEKGKGEISWKMKPKNTKVNRMIVAMSILQTLEQNGREFPPSGNAFTKIVRDKQYS